MAKFTYDEVVREMDLTSEEKNTEGGYRMYFHFLNALNDLLENALSCKEAVRIVDYYSDILDLKRPAVAMPSGTDRIPAICRLMKIDPVLKDFSADRLEVLAFAIFYGYCIEYYDEEKDQILHGMVRLSTLEEIQKCYAEYKEMHPECFPSMNPEEGPGQENFGYSMDNPVRMVSIHDSYAYLQCLQAEKGEIVSCRRLGCVSKSDESHIMDKYEIIVEQKSFIHGTKRDTYIIYIDPYSQKPTFIAPEHFIFINMFQPPATY